MRALHVQTLSACDFAGRAAAILRRTLAVLTACGAAALGLLAGLSAAAAADCPISHQDLQKVLKDSVQAGASPTNGGLGNQEWGAVVDRDGLICAIAFSGSKPGDQWPGGRAVAAEKANTANAFSLDTFAFSTANLYAGAQPGGMLFGIVESSPPSASLLAQGNPSDFGSEADPLVGKRLGGVVVFGGGLALYRDNHVAGAVGVSGDTSCADHNVAWRVRNKLGLDKVPNGVSPNRNDEIIYDIGKDGKSASGYGHPRCHHQEAEIAQAIGSGLAVH